MELEKRQQRIRATTILLVALAAALYAGFILMAVMKA